ncbi:MAG TPA: alpha/beta hydrolase [Burkholderiales bacterium]|nr:alpha/beta hydrolase [Burkholderiales bacterium]
MPSVQAAGRSLNYEWVGSAGPHTLVFLHEGLGSIRQWRDFPAKVSAATGCRALVYDRYGYGASDVLSESRRNVHFMHDEALRALPEMLKELKIEKPILVGHSDGASIALIHAGGGFAVKAVVAMAPHVFIEPLCLKSIDRAAESFEKGDLAKGLGKYHRDARKTFYGWADVWLGPDFTSWDIRDDYLPRIACPVLAIQGEDDEYGTMAQLEDMKRRVKRCELLKLPDCGHSPFKDQPEKVLSAIQSFIAKNR